MVSLLRRSFVRSAVASVLVLGTVASVSALDYVSLKRDERALHVDGRLLVEAQDGGLLMLARDGVLWAVTPEELVAHRNDAAPFQPLTNEAMTERLLAELPAGFDVQPTAHYLIFHNTSRAYAQWCGSLFERLYLAFTNYWSRKGFKLKEPEFPLVAIVFADKTSYLKFTRDELGDAGESIIGYFSLRTNRMTMYDLTGIEATAQARGRNTSAGQISRILSRPAASQQVATIVHEATHQIAFNCGLHTRYSDCPVWFSEGIAIYFETPDLSSSRGWRGIGEVNRPRLARFRDYLGSRPSTSLKTLITADTRFRDTQQSLDAYAEAWALTYYLIRRHPKQYVAYLETLSKKKPLMNDDPQKRLDEFVEAFGDLESLDTEFVRYMDRMR